MHLHVLACLYVFRSSAQVFQTAEGWMYYDGL